MSLITENTLRRAFSDDGIRKGTLHGSSAIAMHGAEFSSPGGIKDLIFSMLTFGIYVGVKSAMMERKREAVERALQDLKAGLSSRNPGVDVVAIQVEGKTLEVRECTFGLQITYGDKVVSVHSDMNFEYLEKLLSREAVQRDSDCYDGKAVFPV
ncbi:hypothetical protein [Paraburkholderia sp. RL17-373-BIF-A]|uniref:hypothetical protein n=1 Tax=Paraburkholderia sp. RL17-373-BIF-A TaxID=3031629 RepID=UPI0038B9B1B7